MSSHYARKATGFTLIELAVVMVILVILAMAAQPSLADFFDRYRLRGAGDSLISLISNARAEAVKTDLDVSVSFTGSGAAWCAGAHQAAPPTGGAAAAAATACDCSNAASTTECRVSGQRAAVETAAYPNVTIGTLPAAFTFNSKMGTIVPLGTRQLTLTSPKGVYDVNVQVNALGQPLLCTPNGRPTMAGVPVCP